MPRPTRTVREPLERVRELLFQLRVRFCLVYRIAAPSEGGDRLRYLQFLTTDQSLDGRWVADTYRPLVTQYFDQQTSALMKPGEANELGERGWGFVIADGPTRVAGLVIVAQIVAREQAEMYEAINRIQGIILGQVPERIERARGVLGDAYSFCLLYKVTPDTDGTAEVESWLQCVRTGEHGAYLLKHYQPFVAGCWADDRDHFHEPLRARDGTLWWDCVLVTRQLRRAECAMFIRLRAGDRQEVERMTDRVRVAFE